MIFKKSLAYLILVPFFILSLVFLLFQYLVRLNRRLGDFLEEYIIDPDEDLMSYVREAFKLVKDTK